MRNSRSITMVAVVFIVVAVVVGASSGHTRSLKIETHADPPLTITQGDDDACGYTVTVTSVSRRHQRTSVKFVGDLE